MSVDNWAPLAGFSIAFCLLLGALGAFSLLLWLTVPFSLFSIRGQLRQQVEILRRIEERLAEQTVPQPSARPNLERPSPGDPAETNLTDQTTG